MDERGDRFDNKGGEQMQPWQYVVLASMLVLFGEWASLQTGNLLKVGLDTYVNLAVLAGGVGVAGLVMKKLSERGGDDWKDGDLGNG